MREVLSSWEYRSDPVFPNGPPSTTQNQLKHRSNHGMFRVSLAQKTEYTYVLFSGNSDVLTLSKSQFSVPLLSLSTLSLRELSALKSLVAQGVWPVSNDHNPRWAGR